MHAPRQAIGGIPTRCIRNRTQTCEDKWTYAYWCSGLSVQSVSAWVTDLRAQSTLSFGCRRIFLCPSRQHLPYGHSPPWRPARRPAGWCCVDCRPLLDTALVGASLRGRTSCARFSIHRDCLCRHCSQFSPFEAPAQLQVGALYFKELLAGVQVR